MKPPVTDNYDFKYLIEKGANYVDKTDFLFQLVAGITTTYFISRPRRFGKSLMISTLKQIFQGRRDLFVGLKIDATNYDWEVYPVVHLNMANVKGATPEKIEMLLMLQLKQIAQKLAIDLPNVEDCGFIFETILQSAASQSPTGKVVLLIDEYDAPMVNNIGEPHFEEIRKTMANFYVEIKNAVEILRFTMITGVTRFTKASIFSALNHMKDITMDADYATMLGYTQEEVEAYFGERLEELRLKSAEPELFLSKVKAWYNGFCFAEECATVYNPVSVGLFLTSRGSFKNYWFDTGSPTYIFRILKEKNLNFFDTIEHPLSGSVINSFEPLKMVAAPLLLQSGYLTIKNAETMMGELYYSLGFPNLEVEFSFNHHLLQLLTKKSDTELDGELVQMKRALMMGNTDRLQELLKSHIAAIPYGNRGNMEKGYQNILFSLFRLLGADVKNEVHINTGRVDCIIENFNQIYILELKFNIPATNALEQIERKAYYLPYLAQGKPITLIGMTFSSKVRNLTEWCVERR